jgi:hypothetical protein
MPGDAGIDLVLLTRARNDVEAIVAIAAPDWLSGEPAPWSAALAEVEALSPRERLHAWGFDLARRCVVRLAGQGAGR